VLHEVVTEIADERGGPCAATLVELAARFHGLCDLAWNDDQRLIARRVEQAGPDRIVLTDVEEAAYRRLRDRYVAIWHDYDPLARWQY